MLRYSRVLPEVGPEGQKRLCLLLFNASVVSAKFAYFHGRDPPGRAPSLFAFIFVLPALGARPLRRFSIPVRGASTVCYIEVYLCNKRASLTREYINRKAETLDDLARAGIHCNSHKSYTKDPFSAMPCNLTSCIALQCLITYYKSNYSSRSKFSLHSTTIRCNSS